MDQFFDRVGNLLRSLFPDEDRPERQRGRSADPDLREAWEELDEYLRTGKDRPRENPSSSDREARRQGERTAAVPEALRRDYGNLEVPVGADDEVVHRAYKRLVREYHPDRYAADPAKQKYATEITQKINESYQRIKRFKSTGRV